jgi:hypothetical protein
MNPTARSAAAARRTGSIAVSAAPIPSWAPLASNTRREIGSLSIDYPPLAQACRVVRRLPRQASCQSGKISEEGGNRALAKHGHKIVDSVVMITALPMIDF